MLLFLVVSLLKSVFASAQEFPVKILDMNERPIPTAFCRLTNLDLPVDSRGNVICEHNKLYEIGAPDYDTVYITASPDGNKIRNAEVLLDKYNEGNIGCADDHAPFRGKLQSVYLGTWRYVQYEDGNDTGDNYQRVTEFQNLVQDCFIVNKSNLMISVKVKYTSDGSLTLSTRKKKKNSDSQINVVLTDSDSNPMLYKKKKKRYY